MKKKTSFDQLKALWDLVWKMLRNNIEFLDGDCVQEVIINKEHPFWVKMSEAMQTISVPVTQVIRSFKDMIEKGNYDWVSPDIREEFFPIPKDLMLGAEQKLFHFNRVISSGDAFKEMEKEGFHPATIWDLLDFGAKNPEEQRKFRIAALGSIVEFPGSRLVIYLSGSTSHRHIKLRLFGNDWDNNSRFLAIRKQS
jgi:hypothetical protein